MAPRGRPRTQDQERLLLKHLTIAYERAVGIPHKIIALNHHLHYAHIGKILPKITVSDIVERLKNIRQLQLPL